MFFGSPTVSAKDVSARLSGPGMEQLTLNYRPARMEFTARRVNCSGDYLCSVERKGILLRKSPPTGVTIGGATKAPTLASTRSTTCSATPRDSGDLRPKVWYFAVASAQSLMLDGAALESVIHDGMERASRDGRERDVWLIMEPAFLSDHPALKSLNADLTKPTAAILSPNTEWMLSYVKEHLPQAVIGKFVAPSVSVPDPLKSNMSTWGQVVGGGGVWH